MLIIYSGYLSKNLRQDREALNEKLLKSKVKLRRILRTLAVIYDGASLLK